MNIFAFAQKLAPEFDKLASLGEDVLNLIDPSGNTSKALAIAPYLDDVHNLANFIENSGDRVAIAAEVVGLVTTIFPANAGFASVEEAAGTLLLGALGLGKPAPATSTPESTPQAPTS